MSIRVKVVSAERYAEELSKVHERQRYESRSAKEHGFTHNLVIKMDSDNCVVLAPPPEVTDLIGHEFLLGDES